MIYATSPQDETPPTKENPVLADMRCTRSAVSRKRETARRLSGASKSYLDPEIGLLEHVHPVLAQAGEEERVELCQKAAMVGGNRAQGAC